MNKEFFFGSAMKKDEAVSSIEEYRHKYERLLHTHGVFYTKENILNYINNFFEPYVQANKPPDGTEWGIGHFFMLHKGRLSFCVVPTPYKVDASGNPVFIIDRYVVKEDKIRVLVFPEHEETEVDFKNISNPPGNGEAFDKGGMWP